MNAVDITGLVAGCATTAAFVPQVLRTWRSRNVEDISHSMYLVFCIGLFCWIAYGLQIHSWPIVAFNVITLTLAGSILLMKIAFRRA